MATPPWSTDLYSMTTPAAADIARKKLIRLLQRAYAGELGAERAYAGHARSVKDPVEKQEIADIRRQELDHRHCVLGMLEALGSSFDPGLEKRVGRVGSTLSFLCRFCGWFLPMYGAAWLEARNVDEYVQAARLATESGQEAFVPELMEMARVEWDHEVYFREKAQSHWLWRFLPHWPSLPPREGLKI